MINDKEKIAKRWKKLLNYKKYRNDTIDPLQDLNYKSPKNMSDLRSKDYRGFNINVTSIWNKIKNRRKV